MKLFRRSKAQEAAIQNSRTAKGRMVNKHDEVGGPPSKAESQRRFMKQLYHLSHAHAGKSKTSSKDLSKDLSNGHSSPAATEPTSPCSSTPERVQVRRAPQNVDTTEELPELIGGCSMDSMLAQLLACTSDFFGDRITAAARCDNPKLPHHKPPTTAAAATTTHPPVPSMITVDSPQLPSTSISPQDLAFVPHEEAPAPKGEGVVRRNIFLFADKHIVRGVDELDEIVDNFERSSVGEEQKYMAIPPSTSFSYYKKPKKGQNRSIADNVWVVSLDEEEDPATNSLHEDISMSSSIPTRHSHRLR